MQMERDIKERILYAEKAAEPAGKSRPAASDILQDNRGVGVVEIILILVVLIALVLIFKTQLTSLVNTIFTTITKNANSVLK